jgi:hypothetical protein
MPLYFFDFHDGEQLVLDEEGLNLRDLVAVQKEAGRALAGLAWDSVANSKGAQIQKMVVMVRDGNGPVMEVEFSFKIVRRQ